MTAMQRRMIRQLSELDKDKTMCPGRLARDCESDLKSVRADLISLEASGKIMFSQRGKRVSGKVLKGPFRLRLL